MQRMWLRRRAQAWEAGDVPSSVLKAPFEALARCNYRSGDRVSAAEAFQRALTPGRLLV